MEFLRKMHTNKNNVFFCLNSLKKQKKTFDATKSAHELNRARRQLGEDVEVIEGEESITD